MSLESLEANGESGKKLPGAAMSRDKLWNLRVDQRSGTPIGYDDPEGTFHPLKLGENLVVERDLKAEKYKVVVRGDKGDVELENGNLPKPTETNNNEQISTFEKLPPLKNGFVRLVHLTNPAVAEKIKLIGLNYSHQGMISSTARWWGKAEDCQFRSDDPRFTYEGAVAVVMDVPAQEIKLHDNMTKAPGVIPAEYLVGIVKQG